MSDPDAEQSTQQPKFGRFICPNCNGVNVMPGTCTKCGADLETGQPSADGSGQSLRQIESRSGPSKRQLIIGGVLVLGLISIVMMMMGGGQQAPAPTADTTNTTTATGAAETAGDPAKARQIAAEYGGLKDTAPEGYTYVDTNEQTKDVKSFGLYSEKHNQKIQFNVWDNQAPVDNLELVIKKVPFTSFGIDPSSNPTEYTIERGELQIGSGPMNYFVGRYKLPEQKAKMVMVGAYRSPVEGKAIVVVAQPYAEDEMKLDYKSSLWLIDSLAQEWTAKARAEREQQSTAKDEPSAASPEEVEAYRKSVEGLLKGKFVAADGAKGTKATVLIGIDPEGKLNKLEVTAPSGTEAVDQALLKAIQGVQPYPAPPGEKPLQLKVTADGANLKVDPA